MAGTRESSILWLHGRQTPWRLFALHRVELDGLARKGPRTSSDKARASGCFDAPQKTFEADAAIRNLCSNGEAVWKLTRKPRTPERGHVFRRDLVAHALDDLRGCHRACAGKSLF